MNAKIFFDSIRHNVFGGKLLQSQVDGINAILSEWERQGRFDLRWLAYILATTYHETARTMEPIEEYGKGKNYDYGKKLKMGKGPGKRIPYTEPDKLYYGRGPVQVTWYENYERLTKAASKFDKGWDFLNNPELLLEMEPSIWATFYGMRTGLFTGRKLSEFFNDDKTDWVNARKIINGLDKAEGIAAIAKDFYSALVIAL